MPTRRDFLKHGCLASAASLAPRNAALGMLASPAQQEEGLSAEYFRRMAKWCAVVQATLQESPQATLAELEKQKGWYHFPYTVLPAAMLAERANAANPEGARAAMRELAFAIGDLLVREDEAGRFSPRLDSYRDVSLWVEAYALLEGKLGAARAKAWKAAIERNMALLVPELQAEKDVAAYTENFLGTSPNHFAWHAATVLVGGVRLGRPEWVTLGSAVLRRFATTEQNPDGYWGEHNPNSPTGGYNYLTTLAVGLYWEHTRDPAAMEALRRATEFHTHTTYSDGNLIELFNDRNRYWEVSPWGQFAFTHFPAGRGYAALLVKRTPDDEIDLDTLGMLAQDALYYHAGPVARAPQETEAYAYRLAAPAGVRKRGAWMVGLCGIVDTPLPRSQWFLERQGNLSVFHERAGLIVCGANSKHQPELATFAERAGDVWGSTPRGGRLEQQEAGDVLALAYNSFSAEIVVKPATAQELEIEVRINGRGPVPDEAYFGLQLCLHAGGVLTSGAGKHAMVSAETIAWSAKELGGQLQHGAWSLEIEGDATLQWPVYPYNPYRNGHETKLEHAVAMLRVPLELKANPQQWLQINERVLKLRIRVSA